MILCRYRYISSIAAWIKNPLQRTSQRVNYIIAIITWISNFFTRNNPFFLSNSNLFELFELIVSDQDRIPDWRNNINQTYSCLERLASWGLIGCSPETSRTIAELLYQRVILIGPPFCREILVSRTAVVFFSSLSRMLQ